MVLGWSTPRKDPPFARSDAIGLWRNVVKEFALSLPPLVRFTSMQDLMQDWKRTRAPHSTACFDCYRCHRGCDGDRPCSRCVGLGRGASCRDPDPNERIPRKRKKPKRKGEAERAKKPKRKCFFVVDPKMFASPKPSTAKSKTSDSRSPSISPSSSSRSPVDCHNENEIILANLACQLDCDTENFSESIDGVDDQRLALYNPVNTPTRELSIFERPHLSSYLSPRPRQTQITLTYETPSAEDLLEDVLLETDEIMDDRCKLSFSDSVFKSLPMPNDTLPFCGSLFMPFVLQDSTQVPLAIYICIF